MHVSVGTQSVWAVTDAGNIYFRTGVAQPLSSPLHPAWLCVNNRKKSLVRFCQVVTSENDLVVITNLALIAHTLVKVLVAIHYSVLDARNGYIRNVVV